MATPQVETVSSGVDKVKLATSLVLVTASIALFYLAAKQGSLVQWSILLVGLLAALVVFLLSEYGRQFIGFAREAVREVKKVVWPTPKETWQMTAYVFGFVVLMALFLWATDVTLSWLLYGKILGWRS